MNNIVGLLLVAMNRYEGREGDLGCHRRCASEPAATGVLRGVGPCGKFFIDYAESTEIRMGTAAV
jgi:hypothetical protein